MNPELMEQGTPEYKEARAGKVTASRIGDVLAKPRRGQQESTTRRNYLAQVACEIMTGKSAEREFQTYDMKRGIELEPRARVEYEMRRNVTVRKVGFVEHPRITRAGCSPDGMVGDEGLVQFKCPIPAVHFEYIEAWKVGKVPTEYYAQVQFELGCTGRQWSDFVSYNEQMADHLQLIVIRCRRDDEYIGQLEQEVERFLQDVDAQIARLPKPGEEPDADLVPILEQSIAQAKEQSL